MRKKIFKANQAAENEFARALKKVARHSGHIVEAHVHGATIHGEREMLDALHAYSKLIDPWARRQSAKLLERVAKSNKTAYQKAANAKLQKKNATEIKLLLNDNVTKSAVGDVAAILMQEQVELIKSIPMDAGLRAQKLAMKALLEGARADEVAKELKDSTGVSESKAALIARTETARANASLTEARASSVGATWYIWRTTMDGAEREAHAKMNGKPVEYSKPPKLDDGTTGHAGTFPNCRCYQDVQFDDK